jgi:hypothetical protein
VKLGSRLRRLEQVHFRGGRCALCRDRPSTVLRSATEVELEDSHDPDVPSAGTGVDGPTDDFTPCPSCGWQPTVLRIKLVLVSGNADKACSRECGAQEAT